MPHGKGFSSLGERGPIFRFQDESFGLVGGWCWVGKNISELPLLGRSLTKVMVWHLLQGAENDGGMGFLIWKMYITDVKKRLQPHFWEVGGLLGSSVEWTKMLRKRSWNPYWVELLGSWFRSCGEGGCFDLWAYFWWFPPPFPQQSPPGWGPILATTPSLLSCGDVSRAEMFFPTLFLVLWRKTTCSCQRLFSIFYMATKKL